MTSFKTLRLLVGLRCDRNSVRGRGRWSVILSVAWDSEFVDGIPYGGKILALFCDAHHRCLPLALLHETLIEAASHHGIFWGASFASHPYRFPDIASFDPAKATQWSRVSHQY